LKSEKHKIRILEHWWPIYTEDNDDDDDKCSHLGLIVPNWVYAVHEKIHLTIWPAKAATARRRHFKQRLMNEVKTCLTSRYRYRPPTANRRAYGEKSSWPTTSIIITAGREYCSRRYPLITAAGDLQGRWGALQSPRY